MRFRVLFTATALSLGGILMATERPVFSLERAASGIEVRQYKPYLVAQTEVTGSMEEAGNEGFRRLAGYIFGGNQAKTKLAMTAPVTMTPIASATRQTPKGDAFIVQFMMPSGYTLASLPPPKDDRVVFLEIPSRRVAALTYRGGWSEARFREYLVLLRSALEREGLKAKGEAEWARYDPPFKPWFLRTNEILVEIQP